MVISAMKYVSGTSMIKNILKIAVAILVAFTSTVALAQHNHLEKEYQQLWCSQNQGELEVVLADGARVDCVTDTYAIEFDFASKWAESIGQSLYYSEITGKSPGIVLILEQPDKEKRYMNRLEMVAKKFGIKTWYMFSLD